MSKLLLIQNELRAPKLQFNKFGNYKYRSCEDILEAVKPLLSKHKAILVVTDSVKEVCGNMFIEAKTVFIDLENTEVRIEVTAQAGIDLNAKGMSASQAYGAASSYARKYALNGLFLIDDTKDADATNTHGKEETEPKKPELTAATFKKMIEAIGQGQGDKVKAAMGNYSMTEQQKVSLETALKNV